MSTTMIETQPTTWKIDAAHTQIEFEVRHMMFAKVRGRFGAFEGTIALGPEGDIGGSSVSVVIDATTIDTGQEQRDEHLRSGDFFDVEQHPQLMFESTGVRTSGEDTLFVTGDLTIRGLTKTVELEVLATGHGIDPWGNERMGFSAKTTIDRRDYGLTWNQALETGGILVGNDVEIAIEAQAVLQET